MRRFFAPTLLILLAINSQFARGEVIITASEVNGNVEFVGSGSIDLTSLLYLSESGLTSKFRGNTPVSIVGPVSTPEEIFNFESPRPDYYLGISNFPSEIGPQNFTIEASLGAGDMFGIDSLTTLTGHLPALVVPANYTSGTQLLGTSTFLDHSFNSLGITPGSYTWSWGSGETFAHSHSLSLLSQQRHCYSQCLFPCFWSDVGPAAILEFHFSCSHVIGMTDDRMR